MGMNQAQTWLYEKIQAFELDAVGAVRGFSHKLAHENQWSLEFTQQAIAEYKKFVFLAMVTRHMVVPSDAIDRVWHLHLTYTRNYWEDFCGEVLGKPLHHSPSQGGSDEFQKFVHLYRQTLSSYEQFFDDKPPGNLWPAVEKRFSAQATIPAENQDVWVLSKPSWLKTRQIPKLRWRIKNWRWLSGAIFFCLGFLMLDASAWAAEGTVNPFNLTGPSFLSFYMQLALVTLVTVLFLRWQYSDSASEAQIDDLTPYEVACLSANGIRAIDVAIVNLLEQQHLQISSGGQVLEVKTATDLPKSSLERRIAQVVEQSQEACGLNQVYAGVFDEVTTLSRSLQDKALYLTSEEFTEWQLMTIAPILLILGVGALKIFIGWERHHPVGHLIALCLIVAYFGFWIIPKSDKWSYVGIFQPVDNQRSAAGKCALKLYRQRYEGLRNAPGQGESLMMAIALFGVDSLQGDDYLNLRTLFTTEANKLAALYATSHVGMDGCSSGCSNCGSACGGSCGGGCGGCSS